MEFNIKNHFSRWVTQFLKQLSFHKTLNMTFGVELQSYSKISLFARVSLASTILLKDGLINHYLLADAQATLLKGGISITQSTPILILALFVITGFMWRLSLITLFLVYIKYCTNLNIMHLGPLFASTLFLISAFMPHKSKYALDNILFAKLKSRYKNVSENVTTFLECLYPYLIFYLFFTYALNSFAAVLLHLSDENWLNGTTIWRTFTNNYLSRHFDSFRQIESFAPNKVLIAFSGISIGIQTFFQFFMMPLVFSKIGKLFVMIYGYLFFFFSWTLLQLSILPAVEVILWTIIFWNTLFSNNDIKTPIPSSSLKHYLHSTLTIVFTIFTLSLTFITINNTLLKTHPEYAISNKRWNLRKIGIWPPNVFNSTDIKMGETWFVLYSINDLGERTRVPIFFKDGSRDKLHLYDSLYYGATLAWRRNVISNDNIDNYDIYVNPIIKIAKFYYHKNKDLNIQSFYYDVYKDNSMTKPIGDLERFNKEKVFSSSIKLDLL